MALSSTSTFDEVVSQYDDNAGYDIENSVAKAKLFVEACRILKRRRPTGVQGDGQYMQYTPESITEELNAALAFLAANDRSNAASSSAGSVRAYSFNGVRG